jgi:hypothetical protein
MKGKKTGGRQAGTPNKLTGAVKEMILTALEQEGGIEYLRHQARRNPTAFLQLVGKVLPLQVNADVAGNLTVSTTVVHEYHAA